ncbi:putative harbinger transposase-derived protein [Helianthus annuus]|nr:putative harbinger transposase-derived protein [Helianthus annuus]KAJ0637776.1 putative harbinger transposase-derived protein [Helianthus annuus]
MLCLVFLVQIKASTFFEQSSIIEDHIAGNVSVASFWVNGNEDPHDYFLADGIYPEYTFVVKTFRDHIDYRRAPFKKVQEFDRKNIERLFGVLQQRLHFARNPCQLWHKDKVRNVMCCCLILHNMTLDNERKMICQDYDPQLVEAKQHGAVMEQRIQNSVLMRNCQAHQALMGDLVQHA